MYLENHNVTRVLVIQDDLLTRTTLMRHCLCNMGLRPRARHRRRGDTPAAQWQCRIALMDLTLPDGTTLDLLEQIRAGGSEIKVALITGTGDGRLLCAALDREPDLFMQKPVDVAP